VSDNTASTDDADKLLGQELDGKYRLSSIIGRGAMGVVFKGDHLLMNRTIAVKLLHSHLVEDKEWLRRFKHEAKVASMLQHPHSVSIYDYGVSGKLPYIVMEFVEGEPLGEMITRMQRMDWATLSPIMYQVAQVLHEAHRLGIIHRDIKPENILIARDPSERPHVRVLDFGVAKLLESSGATPSFATQHGLFLGTPRYASPEQALAKPLDGRSDLYAAGVVMYEALSGSALFVGSNPVEILLQRVSKDPPPLFEAVPGISREVSDLVAQCLARDPALRFQTGQELAEAIRLVDSPREKLRTTSLSGRIAGGAVAAVALVTYLLFGRGCGEEQKPVVSEVTTTTLAVVTPPTLISTIAPTAAPTAPPTATPTAAVTVAATSIPSPTAVPTSGRTISPDILLTPIPEPTVFEPTPFPTAFPSATSIISPELTATPVDWGTWNPEASQTQAPFPSVYPTEDSSELVEAEETASYSQGIAIYRKGQYAQALALLSRSIELNPNRLESRMALATSLSRLGRLDQSLEVVRGAIRRFPQSAAARFELACILAQQNQRDEALDTLEDAISLDQNAKRWAQNEPDLASIKGTRRFADLTKGQSQRRRQSSSRVRFGDLINRVGRSVEDIFGR